MPVIIKPVLTSSDLKRFVYLPELLNAHRPGWVPPFYADDRLVLDPRRNPALNYCEHALFLAWEGEHPVGRVAAIVNRRYNETNGTQTARFGFWDARDDFATTQALAEAAELWAREHGMTRIVGPMGFTDDDPLGFIIEGYRETPSIGSYQNLPALHDYLEQLGYGRELDFVVHKLDLEKGMSPLQERIFERVSRGAAFRLVEFRQRRELQPYVKPILELMNDSFGEIYGFSRLDARDIEFLARRYLPLLDPRFVKVAVNPANRVVAFMISMPNMASGIIKARGRLLPFGFLHLMRAAKKTVQLDNYLGAVAKEHQGQGVEMLVGWAVMRTARNAGFQFMDGHHVMETNYRMRAEMEHSGGRIYKRFRLYGKELQA